MDVYILDYVYTCIYIYIYTHVFVCIWPLLFFRGEAGPPKKKGRVIGGKKKSQLNGGPWGPIWGFLGSHGGPWAPQWNGGLWGCLGIPEGVSPWDPRGASRPMGLKDPGHERPR